MASFVSPIYRGITLFEQLIVLSILSISIVSGIIFWHEHEQFQYLAKEQQRFHLFLRQFQINIENSDHIWLLSINRNLSTNRWCVTVQLKNERSCDCFSPHLCPTELSAAFYYPLQPNKTMISAKVYYPQRLLSFNPTRNSTDPACLMLQLGKYRTLFYFSNIGRIRLQQSEHPIFCKSGEDE